MTDNVEPQQDYFAPPEPTAQPEPVEVPTDEAPGTEHQVLRLQLPIETVRALRDACTAVADGKPLIVEVKL